MEKLPLHKAVYCNIDTNVLDIANKLRKEKTNLIFVLDEKKIPVGVISHEDLRLRVHSSKCQEIEAKDVMEKINGTVDISQKVENIYRLMKKNGMVFTPIMDKEKLVGVVYSTELMEFLDE